MRRRYPDFVTYFGTPAGWAFVPLAFWVFPSLTPVSCRELINAYLTDPWVQA